MKNIILVVLYNENITTSITLNSFLDFSKELTNYKLVVWDNSPSSLENDDLQCLNQKTEQFEYIHTPENISLAKIYNSVINNNLDKSALFIFDQDTKLSLDYFNKVTLAFLENKEINLFMPYVLADNKIVSPGDFFLYKGRYWKELKLGRVLSENKLAVASGMAIRINLFRDSEIRFDEKLKFYGIDSKFMLDYSLNNKFFFVVNHSLRHELSQFEVEDKQTKIKRFRSLKSSGLYLVKSKSYVWYLFSLLIWFVKSILFCLNFKTLEPLKRS